MTGDLAGQRVTVWGLGAFGGGVAAARFLVEAGADVTVTDLKDASALAPSIAALDGLPIRFVLGEHRAEDLLEADLVVKSPAIPPSAPWVGRVEAAGVPVTAEVVLGLERLPCPYVAVTGSKGKSTTASIMGAMAGARVLGNNERPLLAAVPDLGPGDRVVLEVSSFMAHAIARAPAPLPRPVACAFTWLEPEHLNWHGTLEAYYGEKLSLLRSLGPAAAIFPAADRELARRVPAGAEPDAALVRTWLEPPPAGAAGPEDVHVAGERVFAGGGELFGRDDLRILGDHNLGNALLAAAGARALGAGAAAIRAGARAFAPLPHRLETVAVRADGVRFVDDSTATTPTAAAAALGAVGAPAVLLAGGSDKGASFGPLAEAAAARAHAVVCLGEVGEAIAAGVEAARSDAGRPEVVRVAGSFAEAFAAALDRCPAGGTVLLAPGTASYDMFPNFKVRGETFQALARAACQEIS